MDNKITFLDCTAALSGNVLTVHNSQIGRSWLVADTGLIPQQVLDMAAGETLTESTEENISPVELTREDKIQGLTLEGGEDDDCGFSAKSLRCRLTATYSMFTIQYEIVVYPSLPILRTRIFIKGSCCPPLKKTPFLDTLTLQEKHCEWENIFLRAVTDSHNSIMQTQRGLFYLNEGMNLSGNILRVHRTLQNSGLILIKEAPTADEQVNYGGCDFAIFAKKVDVCTAGYAESDIREDEYIPLYGSAIGLYRGGDLDFYRLIKGYHEARHVLRPKDDAGVYSNTWGDDSGGRNINEAFIQEELQAAHEIGITHYQIDAGWDMGVRDPATGRNEWKIKYKALPFGFEKIRSEMKQYAMTLGLWFEPYTVADNDIDYGCYRQDAQTLIDLYRNHGAVFFKFDGFKLLSYTATFRLEKMMQLVLAETDYSTFFNIDITNWPRTGFFGATQYANLFFENRYTDRLSYYPHYTLRNLWMASRYIPAYRLQTEFLNVDRNVGLYNADEAGDALMPCRCGQDYAAACTLFASPLAWMEPSVLNEQNKKLIERPLKATQSVREEIASSLVLPIGDIPNGAHFTGFQAMVDENSGYLLLLKERSGGEDTFRYKLYTEGLGGSTVFTEIASNCDCGICVAQGSEISVSMNGEFSYAVLRYTR
ncbi:MAG: alpha-galactosidase [Acetanaerobacterium sp.]